MPRRETEHPRILIIGFRPIIIGQAANSTYYGTQALQRLSRDGYEVVSVNSNPATIMKIPISPTRTDVELT